MRSFAAILFLMFGLAKSEALGPLGVTSNYVTITPNCAWWRMSEGQGSVIQDYSSTGGSAANALWFTNWMPGEVAGSYSMGFVGSYVSNYGVFISALTNLAVPLVDTNIFISWWQYNSNSYAASNQTIWSMDTSVLSVTATLSFSTFSDTFYAGIYSNTTDYRVTLPCTTANAPQNAWTFYAISISSTAGTVIFTNGVAAATNTTPPMFTSNPSNYVCLGGNQQVHSTFSGRLEDIRITTNIPPTYGQILALYTNGPFPYTNAPNKIYQRLNGLTRTSVITTTTTNVLALEPNVLYNTTSNLYVMWFTQYSPAYVSSIWYCDSANGLSFTDYKQICPGHGSRTMTNGSGGYYMFVVGNGAALADPINLYCLASDGQTIVSGPTQVIAPTQGGWTGQAQLSNMQIDSGGVWHGFANPWLKNGLDQYLGGQWLCAGITSANNGTNWSFNGGLTSWMNLSSIGSYNGIFLTNIGGYYYVFGQFTPVGIVGHGLTFWTTVNITNSGTLNVTAGLPVLDLTPAETGFNQLGDPSFIEVTIPETGSNYLRLYIDVNTNSATSGIGAFIEHIGFNGKMSDLISP